VTGPKPAALNVEEAALMIRSFHGRHRLALALLMLGSAVPVTAQVTPAAGYVPPDDTPAVRVGATIFADYTVTQTPRATDVDGNRITPNAFNIGRAYINVTGNISHIVAFRVTPDIVRETGTGSSVAGSYVVRLKYAYAQFNLDDWMQRGSWARFGMQQTPWIDFIDTVYRYRFQGPTLEDREGILSSSDVGATFRYVFALNYGDVHGGIYNGDNYNRAEANDQKAFMVRGTFRPLPMQPLLRGVRVTGFYDLDAYVRDAERRRGIIGVTYEHPNLNAGLNYLSTKDQTRIVNPKLNGHGLSAWATPKSAKGWGWEGLLRYDHLVQEQASSAIDGERNRTIAGIAYWFPRQGNVSAVLLVDYEWVDNDNYVPARADERRWAVHTLINF
jgi:hypothetical protein